MQYFGFDRPSFGIKTYGFGVSNSKISADFTTGTYNSNGAAKTFADLFTFNRAGKAWLVKETGLQEYEADVPRLDNGLLIEGEATNLILDSLLKQGIDSFDIKSSQGLIASLDDKLGVGYKVTLMPLDSYAYKKHKGLEASGGTISIYASKDSGDTNILVGRQIDFDTFMFGADISEVLVKKINPFMVRVQAIRDSAPSVGFVRYASQNTRSGNIQKHAMQVEQGVNPTTLIVTESSPVTRPADFLLNKITGTTVTGDWDSTLTLSIVAGQLVHSGYGRIRSLEIN